MAEPGFPVTIIRTEQIGGETWHIIGYTGLRGQPELFALERETKLGALRSRRDDGSTFGSLAEAEKALEALKARNSKSPR
jgi:hypothetical protein